MTDNNENNNHKTLHITWQRLVDDSSTTCPRCSDTGENLDAAVDILQPVLAREGIHLLVQKKRMLHPDL